MLPNSAKHAKKIAPVRQWTTAASDHTSGKWVKFPSLFSGLWQWIFPNEFVPGRPTSRNQLIETTTLRYARSSMPTDVAICARL
ncbi:hypothetical protein CDAR_191311 [Caerostris darwini]|uniref:Uncharacterized protein n=1 Tax=Caerostris darwini TaxID=1538125 RepID=A0AAV4X1W0_9ARAC|nr:hypothetical protein CDAR_191311 [Caerostris darwini]